MTLSPRDSHAHSSGNGSPFDAIRRVGGEGERWSGRDLMPLLGYDSWRRFDDAVQRAKIACTNSGADATSHFADAVKVAASGPAGADYQLTRYAAYLVAMNGDPRKPEIAAAQTYFAVKTREAEIAQPASQLDVLAAAVAEMQRIEREMQETRDEVRAVAARAEDTLATVTEIAARQDAIEGRHDWFSGLAYSRVKQWPTDLPSVQRLGRRAGAIARRAGIKPVKVQHGLYGEVNQLPAWCWDQARTELYGEAS